MRNHGGFDRWILAFLQEPAERQRRVGVESRIDRAQVLDAPYHQAGRYEQHERHRDLGAEQQVAHAMALPRGGAAAATLVKRRRTATAPEWNRAEHQGGDE